MFYFAFCWFCGKTILFALKFFQFCWKPFANHKPQHTKLDHKPNESCSWQNEAKKTNEIRSAKNVALKNANSSWLWAKDGWMHWWEMKTSELERCTRVFPYQGYFNKSATVFDMHIIRLRWKPIEIVYMNSTDTVKIRY